MAETNTFYLEITTPEKTFISGNVEQIIVHTPGGEIGVLKGHMPLVVPVSIGAIRIKQDGKWKYAVLSEGFMDISQQQTFVLVDTAEWPDEIDINRAKAAEERARERLQLKLSRLEYIQSQAALQRALSRLELSSKYKK
jgi:F-type H+-transporting ATPase subunit epsilon